MCHPPQLYDCQQTGVSPVLECVIPLSYTIVNRQESVQFYNVSSPSAIRLSTDRSQSSFTMCHPPQLYDYQQTGVSPVLQCVIPLSYTIVNRQESVQFYNVSSPSAIRLSTDRSQSSFTMFHPPQLYDCQQTGVSPVLQCVIPLSYTIVNRQESVQFYNVSSPSAIRLSIDRSQSSFAMCHPPQLYDCQQTGVSPVLECVIPLSYTIVNRQESVQFYNVSSPSAVRLSTDRSQSSFTMCHPPQLYDCQQTGVSPVLQCVIPLSYTIVNRQESVQFYNVSSPSAVRLSTDRSQSSFTMCHPPQLYDCQQTGVSPVLQCVIPLSYTIVNRQESVQFYNVSSPSAIRLSTDKRGWAGGVLRNENLVWPLCLILQCVRHCM